MKVESCFAFTWYGTEQRHCNQIRDILRDHADLISTLPEKVTISPNLVIKCDKYLVKEWK